MNNQNPPNSSIWPCLRVFASFSGFDMSTFIRRYSRYLNEKSFAYRQMSFDFVRVKKGYALPLHTAQTHPGAYARLSPSGVPVVCGTDSGVFR